MGDINDLGSRDVLGMYYRALESVNPQVWLSAIAMATTTDQASEKYPFLGQAPVMQEWLAERNVARLRADQFTVTNVHYESSIEFSKSELRRDKTGQILIRVGEHVQRAQDHWGILTTDLILAGAASACYDGQNFFSTAHPNNGTVGGTQSNKITVDISALPTAVHGSTTAPSPEEMNMAIMAGMRTLAGFLDDQGQPINEGAQQFQVMLPMSLEDAAMTGATSPRGTNSAEQVSKRSYDIQSNVRLDSSWPSTFMVTRTDNPIKPFINQSETEINLSAKAEGSDFTHDTDRHQYGIDTWRTADYGQWQNAIEVTLV